MPAGINYKNKYLELRSKYIGDLDTAFRLGVEAGQQQAQQQQAVEAEANAQEMQMQQQAIQAGANQKPGEPGQGGPPGGEAGGEGGEAGGEGAAPPGAGAQMQARGSELDEHIGKLETMLGSGKPKEPEVQKSMQEVLTMLKKERHEIEMKKSELAIAGIAKALHKPAFKLGVTAQHNMGENAKQALSTQHKIVNDIFKSWDQEEKKASNSIENILQSIVDKASKE